MIVYVDDAPDEFLRTTRADAQSRFSGIAVSTSGSRIDELETIREADTWVFDYFFADPVRENPADFHENGLSLFFKWRRLLSNSRPPTAVVSADLERAIGPLAAHGRRFIHAMNIGVEWVGDKSDSSLSEKLIELSDASQAIAQQLHTVQTSVPNHLRAPTLSLNRLCFDVLNLDRECDWRVSAQRHVDGSRPPRSLPGNSRFGPSRILISWLLSHVFPFSSFLISDAQAAVRLNVSLESFRAVVSSGVAPLLSTQYQGILADFDQRRWWRAGIDHLVWSSHQSELDYHQALRQFAGAELELLPPGEPVVLSDADLVETERIEDATQCVRATDEYFPAHVDPVWVLIEDARHDRELRTKVLFEDTRLIVDQ